MTPEAVRDQGHLADINLLDTIKMEESIRTSVLVFEEYDMPGVTMRNSIATGGGAKTAWFKDTEGNILAISQRL